MKRPRWYLKAPKKKNREWTRKDRRHILNLLEKGKTSEEIANMYGVTKTHIYNQTRLGRREGQFCFKCTSKLTAKEKRAAGGRTLILCNKCKKELTEYKRKLREKSIRKGECAVCGHKTHKKALPGRKTCKDCVSATHRRREEKGLCGFCGIRPINTQRSIALCDICLNKNKNYNIFYRRLRRSRVKV